MAEQKTKLRHLHSNIYEDVTGGMEPLFARTVERGGVEFGHQSGYGYLPESRVEVVADGVDVPGEGQQ